MSPPVREISLISKSVVASLKLKLTFIEASLLLNPLAPSLTIIESTVGFIESYVQVNVPAASLLFPTSSANAPPAIDIVFVPSLSGVKVTE